MRTIIAALAVAASLALAAPAQASTAPTAEIWPSQACVTSGPHAGHVVVLWGVVSHSDQTSVVTDASRNSARIDGPLDPQSIHAALAYVVPGRTAHLRATVTFADGTVRHPHVAVPAWACN